MAKQEARKKLGRSAEMLPVKLRSDELLERAKRIGDVHEQLHVHLAEADAAKRKLKTKEANLTEEIDRIAHALRTGAEPREVEVEAWADFEKGRFLEIRSDNGQVIRERKLRDSERQGEFEIEEWQLELHERVVQELTAAKRMPQPQEGGAA